MNIALDALKALAPRDGIGNFTRELLSALIALPGPDRIVISGLPGIEERGRLECEIPSLSRYVHFSPEPAHPPAKLTSSMLRACGFLRGSPDRSSSPATT